MAKVTVFDQKKESAGSIELSPEIFEVEVRPEILNFVVRAQRSAMRSGTHSTLTRSMMKGGGAKPFRQKGTGRARAGSNISPLWTGGAVVFGPQPRSYEFKVNKKVWRLALKMAVSARLAKEKLLVVNKIELAEAKTKLFAQLMKDLSLGKSLIVITEEMSSAVLAARNLPDVKVITASQLNVYDILKYRHLVLTEGAVEQITARLSA